MNHVQIRHLKDCHVWAAFVSPPQVMLMTPTPTLDALNQLQNYSKVRDLQLV